MKRYNHVESGMSLQTLKRGDVNCGAYQVACGREDNNCISVLFFGG